MSTSVQITQLMRTLYCDSRKLYIEARKESLSSRQHGLTCAFDIASALVGTLKIDANRASQAYV